MNIDLTKLVTAAQKAAEAQAAARLSAIDTSIKNDTVLASLKEMTSSEYDAWWVSNVTTSAQAIGVLKRVVRVILRRVL